MNQKKKLLILCVVMVVLLVAFLIIKTSNDASEAEQLAAEEQAVLDSMIYVSNIDSTTVTGVSWTYTDELSFELVDDVWTYAEDSAFPLSTSYVTSVVDSFSVVVAERELSAEEGLASYGLEEPQYEASLTDADGVTTTFYIGNLASDDNYYVTTGDKTSVYTITSDVVSSILYGMTDIIVGDTFTAVTSDMITKVVKTLGETETTYTADDADILEVIATGAASLAFDTCVDYATDDESLSVYGLTEESRGTITITYEVTTTETLDDGTEETTVETYEEELWVGLSDETGENFYVQVAGSGLVYAEAYEAIIYMFY